MEDLGCIYFLMMVTKQGVVISKRMMAGFHARDLLMSSSASSCDSPTRCG